MQKNTIAKNILNIAKNTRGHNITSNEFTRNNYSNIVVDILTRKKCLARALFVSLTARRKKIDNNGVTEWSNYSSTLNVRAHNLLKEYIYNLLEAQAKQPAQE